MSEENKSKRGRPRKVAVTENSNILSDETKVLKMEEKKLSEKDVFDSLTSLYTDVLGKDLNGSFTANISQLNEYNPFLQNTRLKMINSYPSSFAPSEISEFLSAPQDNELNLQSASSSLSASQYLYYKILREACDIPLYKYYVIPENLAEDDYNLKDFKTEERFVNNWLDTMHIPATFRKISMEVKREGKPSYLFRQHISENSKGKQTDYVTFQKLPSAYVKLTGIGKYGYIASFNMMIFLQPAFSPLQYPQYIQDIWNELTAAGIIERAKKGGGYTFSKTKLDDLYSFTYKNEDGDSVHGVVELVKTATQTSYMYWVQLPQNLCFTFASDMSNAWAAPDTMGLFTALQELTDYSTLAGLIASTPLTAILTGQIEFVDGAQPGQDQTKISPHGLDAFMNTFNAMVSSNINAYFGPFKDMKLQSLPNIPNSSEIKTKALQSFITQAGEGGLISATDKPSVAAIKAAQFAAEAQYDFVTRQIEDAVNGVLKDWCDCKYEWKVKFWGGIYTFDNRVAALKELVAGGATFLLPKLASAYDMNLCQVDAVNNYVKARKIYDGFKTIGWASTQQAANAGATATSGKAGRKALDDNNIENDSTAQSRETGANISELKKDYSDGRCIECGEYVENEGDVLCEECKEKHELEGPSYD